MFYTARNSIFDKASGNDDIMIAVHLSGVYFYTHRAAIDTLLSKRVKNQDDALSHIIPPDSNGAAISLPLQFLEWTWAVQLRTHINFRQCLAFTPCNQSCNCSWGDRILIFLPDFWDVHLKIRRKCHLFHLKVVEIDYWEGNCFIRTTTESLQVFHHLLCTPALERTSKKRPQINVNFSSAFEQQPAKRKITSNNLLLALR